VTQRFVVIGGDAGGMSAAAQARRRSRDASDLEIVAFERSRFTSYSACGLPYFVAGTVDEADDLIARTPTEHAAMGVDVRVGHEVVRIDAAARTVAVQNLAAGAERIEPFDQLLIATGAVPIRPDLPGVNSDGVHGIQNMADGIALRAHLDEHHDDHHRAVVVGGGYVGLEMAESMHQRGLPVTVVDSGEQPMSTLDPEIGARVADAMRALGIDVRMQTRATAFETDTGDHVRAVSTSEGTIDADVVVLGIGVRPNVQLAHDAGIALGPTGAIATDDRMQTSVAGVWAAGDCVEVTHRVTGKKAYVPLGTHANKQGRVVGVNVTGGDAHFRGVVGTAVTKICAYEIGRTGLSEREAKEAGFEVATATIETTTRAAYFPGAQPITVKVVAERPAGRLLGAQVFGREGAAKRVDIAAVAIWAGLAVDEIGQLDLGYAPPFSPLWDPVLVAANQAARELALL